MHTDASPHLFWITSRAAGTVSLLTASVAVGLGLLMATRRLRGRGPDLRVTHEILSLATMVALVIHAGALVGDGFLHPSVLDVSVPFASSYKTLWTSMGIVGAWMLIVLGLSYYARARIGQDRWRRLHRITALAWLLGVAHTLGEGTRCGPDLVLDHGRHRHRARARAAAFALRRWAGRRPDSPARGAPRGALNQ